MNALKTLPSLHDQTRFMIEKYRDLDRQIKALEKEKELVGKELKSGFFLHHQDFIHEGRLLATYKPTIVIRFNQNKFKAELPEVFETYQEAKEEFRFLLK
jgi:predicted phage-related endonuclease